MKIFNEKKEVFFEMRNIRNLKKVLLVTIFLAFVFGFAGCSFVSSIFPQLEDEVLPPVNGSAISLNWDPPVCIIMGKNSVNGGLDFWEKMDSLYSGETRFLRGRSLIENVDEYLEDIKKFNVILLIISPTPDGIQEFREMEAKYPSLCPLSATHLVTGIESYSAPLMYFSESTVDPESQLYMVRGVIVANNVTSLLAEQIGTGGSAVRIFFRYDENGHLEILEYE